MSDSGQSDTLVRPVIQRQDADASLVVSIVEAVAQAEDIQASSVEPPLYDVVETDALEKLIEKAGPTTTVQFSFAGYTIVVAGDRQVSVFE